MLNSQLGVIISTYLLHYRQDIHPYHQPTHHCHPAHHHLHSDRQNNQARKLALL